MNISVTCACLGPPGNCPCMQRGLYQFTPYLAPPLGVSAWMCPKCNAVYGPTAMECWRCNPPAKIEVTCNTGSTGESR